MKLSTCLYLGMLVFVLGAITGNVASAQAWGYSVPMGDGWYRHSWTDGTAGYSMPMGDGWYRHSLSDGTTGYTMPLYESAPASPASGYGLEVPYLEIRPLQIAPLTY